MKPATESRIASRWLELYERGETTLAPEGLRLPARNYVDPEHFIREREVLFRESPVVACLSADIQAPGDYVTTDSGGVPLLVVRGPEGEARAFVNVCRHRSAPVARGCGRESATFRCPFHGWTYGLDGRLRGQPRSMGGFDQLDPAELGLRSLPVAEGSGLVVVRPGGGASIDLPAFLAGMGEDLDAFGLTDYVVYERTHAEWTCNWKLLVDTFLESYHVFALHGASVGPDYPGHVMVFDAFGPHLRVPVPRASLIEVAQGAPEDRRLLPHATVQYFLAPNTMVNHTLNHFILWRLVPLAVNRTRAEMTMYTPGPVEGDEAERELRAWFELHESVTRDEDYPESERIHAVLASGVSEATHLGRNEAALIHFHRWLGDQL